MRVLSVLFIVVGVVILAATLSAGGGVLALGTFMGVAFIGVGCGRLWLATRMSS